MIKRINELIELKMGNKGTAHTSYTDNDIMPIEVFNLHIAVMQNDARAVATLGHNGVDVDSPWKNFKYPSVKDGTTALCEAISLNHKPVVEELLKLGSNLNKADSYGYTPLHKAAYHIRLEIAKLLINKGANSLQTDLEGDTPLHLCCKIGVIHPSDSLVKMAQLLLQSPLGPYLVNKANKKGKTALHLASEWGLPQMIQLLVELGSHVDALDISYRTPLHCCIDTLLRFDSTSSRKLDMSAYVKCIRVLLTLNGGEGCDPLNLAELLFSYNNPSLPYLVDGSERNAQTMIHVGDNSQRPYGNCCLARFQHLYTHNYASGSNNNHNSNDRSPISTIRSYIENHLKRSFKSASSPFSTTNTNNINNNTTNFQNNHSLYNDRNLCIYCQNLKYHSMGPLAYLIPHILNAESYETNLSLTATTKDRANSYNSKSLWTILHDKYIPPTLKQLCRTKIRRCLNQTQDRLVKTVTKQLRLPKTLKEYLLRVPI